MIKILSGKFQKHIAACLLLVFYTSAIAALKVQAYMYNPSFSNDQSFSKYDLLQPQIHLSEPQVFSLFQPTSL